PPSPWRSPRRSPLRYPPPTADLTEVSNSVQMWEALCARLSSQHRRPPSRPPEPLRCNASEDPGSPCGGLRFYQASTTLADLLTPPLVAKSNGNLGNAALVAER